MKKSLIALAVAGTFAAPAFAATSNVDIYGKLTESLDFITISNGNTTGGGNGNSQAGSGDDVRLSSNSSRIGFKGSEDLGGGLAAIWQIENQLNMDGTNNGQTGAAGATSGGNFSSNLRNTFMGLKSDTLGTVLFGRHDTPYKIATGSLDIFGDSSADYNNIISSANGANAFDLRTSNTFAYVSPAFSGLTVAVAYVIGDEGVGPAAGKALDAYSAAAMYSNGPLFASAAYELHNNFSAGNKDQDAFKLGVGYKFGDAKVGGVFESINDDVNGTAVDRNAYYVNGQYAMGSIVLKGAFGLVEDGNSAADTSATTWTLGADYLLSKRSKVYMQYTSTNNDRNAIGGGSTGIAQGQGSQLAGAELSGGSDPAIFSLGMVHTF